MLKTKPCPDCDGRGFIAEFTEYSVLGKKCSTCDGLGKIKVPMTNADRIRAMTDEELADWMYNGISTDPCDYCEYNNGHCGGTPCRGKADAETIIEWLQQPAE